MIWFGTGIPNDDLAWLEYVLRDLAVVFKLLLLFGKASQVCVRQIQCFQMRQGLCLIARDLYRRRASM